MIEDKPLARKEQPQVRHARPTIGLLLPDLSGKNVYDIWKGVSDVAQAQNVNVISFMTRALDTPLQFHKQANVLFDLISANSIDGLMIWTPTLAHYGDVAGVESIFGRYSDMPVLAIDGGPEGIPQVAVDSYHSMREAIIHLIEVHDYRRIAFIRGADNTHAGAMARYQAYRDVLAEYDIPFDPDLVAPLTKYGWDNPDAGQVAIALLLDERGVDFEAAVAASDWLIMSAMRELEARGIHIPAQVAVTGFDDEQHSPYVTPPLTTISLESYEQGRQAAKMLLALLKGDETPEKVEVPLKLVIRQSCGCINPTVAGAAVGTIPAANQPFESITTAQRDEILAEISQAAAPAAGELNSDWAEQLLAAFSADLKGESPGSFLSVLNTTLGRVVDAGSSVTEWPNVVSTLRRCILPHLDVNPLLPRAEDLWLQAQVMIGELAQRIQGHQVLQMEQLNLELNEIGAALITTFDVDALMDILTQELPRLGITGCYLSLYENPQRPTEQSRLILAYDERGRQEIQVGQQVYPSSYLAPKGILPQQRPYNLVVEPLYFREQQLGFVLFEGHQGNVYEVLREQISSALKGALLVQQEEKRARQLQTVAEVSAATSTILDTTELLQQVVDLTKEQFGLYHTHIYLLNEAGDTLDLTAGAGETGQKMVAEGWHIPLGREQSLVARAARNRQGEVVNDVKADPNWFANPYLPETRSEMAVPLMVGERVLGVLDVQSAELNHFSDDDVRIQTTLAAQVAVTLENAHLFEKSNQARQEADHARQEIEIAKEALEVQVWQTTGQAQLNDRMQGEQDISMLADNIVEQLCDYLGAQIGALYVADGKSLNLVGSYSYRKTEATLRFEFGEGLVGQAAVKKKPITVTDTPPDHLVIRSGFNEMAPASIMVFPFIYEGQVLGVIELGTLAEFSQVQLQFIQTAMAGIAIAFNTAQARVRINELLAETQQQAEELQTQSEDLRVANEELEAQTESLKQSESILKDKQTTLDRQNKDLKTAQQELEIKAEELTLASKYKSEFLANMSHELRTPLNSLLILAGILADNKEGNLTADQVESAQVIHSGGTDLLSLINDILDLSKVEAGQMVFTFESMPLTDLVSNMRMQFDHVAKEKELAFNINLAEDLPGRIKTDSQRVRQIVKNLLSNAFKFTSQGSVRLDIYFPDRKVDLSQSGLAPSQAIAIKVTDTGIGMTPEQQKIIFEAFQQAEGGTSRKYGGTGLGLSISRELATKLGGQVQVESKPGQGSTFTIYLPIEAGELSDEATAPPTSTATKAPAAARPPVSPPPVRPASPPLPDDRDELTEADRILLVVEDDSRFAKIVFDFGHTKGFKVLLAGDGETGLKLAQSYRVNAIVLDLNLPGMDGWQVLDNLKQNPDTRHIPVHIMSVEEESLAAYQQGALDFLTKPVSQEDLETSFSKMLQFIERDIKTLLLVEDDINLRRSVKKLLSGNKVDISEAGEGQAALDLLSAHYFDCMILDLSLPDMSGFEVLQQMNEAESISKCPVIVYTGQALTPQENAELMRYADSIIVKGVKSPERLLDETALFLHQVVADLSQDKQHAIRQLHNGDAILAGKKILLVDDDIRNAYALSKLLKEKEMVVEVAMDGQQALELLAEAPDVDLILMDIMMPVLDGYETMRRIRAQQQFKTLPILALTAKAMKGDREKCLEAGANDYLPKPVDPDRLFSMLQVWLYQ